MTSIHDGLSRCSGSGSVHLLWHLGRALPKICGYWLLLGLHMRWHGLLLHLGRDLVVHAHLPLLGRHGAGSHL